MPARNVASVIGQQMAALAQQSVSDLWELIVVDHGSSDSTVEIVRAWDSQLPRLEIVDGSSARALPELRNLGIERAKGAVILHCDADDVVGDRWLEAMVEALETASIVTGPLDLLTLNDPRMSLWRNDQPESTLPSRLGSLPYGLTCNLGTRRELFDQIGGFTPEFRSGSDVDFSWRAIKAGFQLVFEPGAVVHKRFQQSALTYWRREVRYGRFHPLLWKRYKDQGMSPASLRQTLRAWAWIGIHMTDLLDDDRRWHWLARCGNRVGRLLGSIEHRSLYV